MRHRRLACLAAGAAATIALVAPATPAHAVTIGEGAVTGSIDPCVGGQTNISFDSLAFAWGDQIGPLHASGPSNCGGWSVLAESGYDLAIDVNGPGLDCPDLGGAWTQVGPELRLIIGGPCTFTGGAAPRNLQFIVEAAYASGLFVGSATAT